MKTIEIIVSPTGQPTVQTKGFTGTSCRDASRFLEQALGRRTGEQLSTEYFSAPTLRTEEQHQV